MAPNVTLLLLLLIAVVIIGFFITERLDQIIFLLGSEEVENAGTDDEKN